MKDLFVQGKTPFPPYVIGSVSDWAQWLELASPVSMPSCNALELRLDALPESLALSDILAHPARRPTLLTYRHADEGGLRAIPEEQRRETMQALLSMADAIDWEIRHLAGAQELLEAARNARVLTVASYHDFDKTPDVELLREQELYAREQGVDVVKFAFRLHSIEDMMVGLKLLESRTGSMAVMGMGKLGPTSRLLYSQYGSALIYGFLGERATAPGQWSAQLFVEALDQLESML